MSSDDDQGQEDYQVDRILSIKLPKENDRTKIEYFIRWKGFDSDEDSWEPEANLGDGCMEVIQDFLKTQKDRLKSRWYRMHPDIKSRQEMPQKEPEESNSSPPASPPPEDIEQEAASDSDSNQSFDKPDTVTQVTARVLLKDPFWHDLQFSDKDRLDVVANVRGRRKAADEALKRNRISLGDNVPKPGRKPVTRRSAEPSHPSPSTSDPKPRGRGRPRKYPRDTDSPEDQERSSASPSAVAIAEKIKILRKKLGTEEEEEVEEPDVKLEIEVEQALTALTEPDQLQIEISNPPPQEIKPDPSLSEEDRVLQLKKRIDDALKKHSSQSPEQKATPDRSSRIDDALKKHSSQSPEQKATPDRSSRIDSVVCSVIARETKLSPIKQEEPPISPPKELKTDHLSALPKTVGFFTPPTQIVQESSTSDKKAGLLHTPEPKPMPVAPEGRRRSGQGLLSTPKVSEPTIAEEHESFVVIEDQRPEPRGQKVKLPSLLGPTVTAVGQSDAAAKQTGTEASKEDKQEEKSSKMEEIKKEEKKEAPKSSSASDGRPECDKELPMDVSVKCNLSDLFRENMRALQRTQGREYSIQDFHRMCIDRRLDLVRQAVAAVQNTRGRFSINPNLPDSNGKTLLLTMSSRPCDSSHIDEDILEYLSIVGADMNYRNMANGYYALHYAVDSGALCKVKKLLSLRTSVNVAALDGTTPLMLAAQKGKTHMVQYLLETGGADFNATARLENPISSPSGHLRSQTAYELAVAAKQKKCADMIAMHLKRVKENFDEALRTVLRDVRIKRDICPVHCFGLWENSEIVLRFEHNKTILPNTRYGFVVAIGLAKILGKEVQVRLWGPCPVHSVEMNGRPLESLQEDGKFLLLTDLENGTNELKVKLLGKAKHSQMKLLVQVILMQLRNPELIGDVMMMMNV